jgi:hypothetical protein
MKELKARREKEEEERVRAMMPKEREEWKRKRDRLSGEWNRPKTRGFFLFRA